jgi:competence protein ComEC
MTRSRKVKTAAIIFFIAVALADIFGGEPEFKLSEVGFYKDLPQQLIIEGAVCSEPEFKPDKIRAVVDASSLQVGGRKFGVSGKVLVNLPRYPEVKYGNQLKISGKFIDEDASEGLQSYAQYLEKDGIFAMFKSSSVSIIGTDSCDTAWKIIYMVKSFIDDRIKQYFTEPVASIVSGLLLGLRQNIARNILDDFSRTGLTHILAISGYNITMVISIFAAFLGACGRKTRFWGTAVGIFVFVVLTGMSASVIRAAIMGSLTVLAKFCGRKSTGMQALLLSGVIMVALKPGMLLYDMSFQLSYLATLGLLIYVPLFEEKITAFKKLPKILRETLVVTLAAQVLTTPLILFRFGRFSLISPIANVIFLPLIPFIMLFAFMALVCGFPFPFLVPVFAAITWILTILLLLGVAFFSDLPLASVVMPPLPLWGMVIFYLLIAVVTIIFCKPRWAQCCLPRLFQFFGTLSRFR